jgi:hypothetical protein
LEGNKENTGVKNQDLPTLAGWVCSEIEVVQSKLTNRLTKSQKSRKEEKQTASVAVLAAPCPFFCFLDHWKFPVDPPVVD